MSSAGHFPPRAGSQSTCGSRHEAGSVKRGVCVAFIPSHVPAEAVIIHHLPSQNIEPIRKANLSFGECPRVKL